MKQFKNILVAVDSRREDHPALRWAERLAKHNQAKIKIVDIVPEFSWITRLVIPESESVRLAAGEEKRRKLEMLAQPLREQGFNVSTKVMFGKTSIEIMREVLRFGHDLVVRVTKGAHSRRNGFFGTTSLRLLRTCPCAVWLLRPDRVPHFDRVLAAVDPAPRDIAHEMMSNTIMDLGRSIADLEQGQLHVVHAWELIDVNADDSWSTPGNYQDATQMAKQAVVATMDKFLAPYQLTHRSDRVHMIQDEAGPGHAIAELAKQKEIDVVVMGTLARSGMWGAVMGNTAEQVIDQVQCSVLTIKPNGFISPATLPEATDA